jgi:DNA replication protein DnaC
MAAPCELCSGIGFEYVTKDGHTYTRPCACRRAAAPNADSFLSACRIPARYEVCELSNFAPLTPSHSKALEAAMRYCAGYPHLGPHAEGVGLLFTGNNGVGKTHLAVSVLRELVLTKGARGHFWDFHELIREIKYSWDAQTQTTELSVLAPVVETDVLLLDDLGAMRMTDWMNDTLFYILNSRYLARRATIITTNFQDRPDKEVQSADSKLRSEFFVERIGQRTRSRLQEMCFKVHIEGGDQRATKQDSHRALILGTSTGAEPRPPRPRG